MLVAEDDSLIFVENQEVAWKREEGLAKARKALFLDLPAATAELEASYKALKPTLMDRMNAEVLTVKVTS